MGERKRKRGSHITPASLQLFFKKWLIFNTRFDLHAQTKVLFLRLVTAQACAALIAADLFPHINKVQNLRKSYSVRFALSISMSMMRT